MDFTLMEQAVEIINKSVDAILSVDAEGTIQYCNPATLKMFGYKRDELLGSNIRLLMPHHQAQHHLQYMQKYITTGQSRMMGGGSIVQAQHRDGSPLPVHIALSESYTSMGHRFHAIIHDISSLETQAQVQVRGVCQRFIDLYTRFQQDQIGAFNTMQSRLDRLLAQGQDLDLLHQEFSERKQQMNDLLDQSQAIVTELETR